MDIFLGLGMVYEFDLLVRGLHPWLVIWYILVIIVASWLQFYGGFLTWNNLHQEVCVEGHDIGYDLHGFFLVLVIFLDIWFLLHWIWDFLDILIIGLCLHMLCERWHGYYFISFFCWLWRTWESIGNFLWEFFLQVIG